MTIMNRLRLKTTNPSLKEAYITPVEKYEKTKEELVRNRLILRNYLQDFEHYSTLVAQKNLNPTEQKA